MSPTPSSSKKALVLCLFQSLAGVIFGWGNSSGGGLFIMEPYIQRFGDCDASGNCSLSTLRQSSITALLSLGAAFGAVSSGWISNRIGLRVTCMIFIFIHMVGAAIECSGKVYQQVYVARILLGLGIGATSGLVPVFQAEAAPPKWRGLVTGSFQLCVTLGIFGVSICSWGMHFRSGNKTWRVVTGLPMAFDFGLLLGFVFMPESPSFLAKKGLWDKCRKSLASLRSLPIDDPAVDEEMKVIAERTEEAKIQGEASYSEIFTTKNRILFRVMVGVCVQIGQQITGVNFFFSYGPQFAAVAQLSDTYIFQIIIASVNVGMSFPGIYFVDRFGRRPVLLVGAFTMFLGQIITGSVSKAHPNSKQAGDALIAFSCLFIAGFASSWGPVAWVVAGESFPIRLSALGVTIATAANWLMNMTIAFAAPQIQNRIGTGICFVWAGCLALNFIFAFTCIPETKGLSIEEIDALYIAKIPAPRTGRFLTDEDKRKIADIASRIEKEKAQHGQVSDSSHDVGV